MRTYIFPYNVASQGAKELSISLPARRIKRDPDKSKFVGGGDKCVVNWGNSAIDHPEVHKCHILNKPEAVATSTNKLRFFEMALEAGFTTPDWTTDPDVASGWWNDKPNTRVFARTKLTGHSGEGIVEVDKPEDLFKFPRNTLLVKYQPKKDEYRVHLISDYGIFDAQRKARRLDVVEPNWRIRNHGNGFVYARAGVADMPNIVKEEAEAAFKASGLDFGAVDVLYNLRHNRAYVLEINCAPGIEGTTVEKYSHFIARKIDAL